MFLYEPECNTGLFSSLRCDRGDRGDRGDRCVFGAPTFRFLHNFNKGNFGLGCIFKLLYAMVSSDNTAWPSMKWENPIKLAFEDHDPS